MNRLSLLSAIVFVCPVALFSGWDTVAVGQKSVDYKPVVGEVHADFSLPSIEDGKFRNLTDYRGKKVLLFHFASW